MNISEIESNGTSRSEGSLGRDTTGYRVRGERVPSVTDVIEIAGLSDIETLKAKAGAEVVDNAARRGNIVHGYCELLDLDPGFQPITIPEAYRGYASAWQRFCLDSGFESIDIERVVVSEGYRFAGTLDRLGLMPDGQVWVIDLKTPATPSPTWAIQSAGYALAVEDSRLATVDVRASIRLRGNGTYKLDRHSDREDTQNFLAALRVAHFRLAHGLATLKE